MPLRYSAAIAAIPDCPASHYAPCLREAYRFVFGTRMADSFQPPLAQKPQRALKMDDLERCSAWALSFFVSAATARAKFEALRRANPKITKALGDSLAVGDVRHVDGVACEPDGDGHFDLHEAAEADLPSRFRVVESLV